MLPINRSQHPLLTRGSSRISTGCGFCVLRLSEDQAASRTGRVLGFREALNRVPVVEMVNLMLTRFRLVRDGSYPPNRGTLCTVNGEEVRLFTTGYVPECET